MNIQWICEQVYPWALIIESGLAAGAMGFVLGYWRGSIAGAIAMRNHLRDKLTSRI